MDIFDEDILRFWRCLHKYEVRYVMVGGFATNLHGFQRLTADLDLLIEDNLPNRKLLRTALEDYGMGDMPEIETIPFVTCYTTLLLNNGFEVDFIGFPLKGLEQISFQLLYDAGSVAEIYDVPIRFLHINHLIANKQAVLRAKDKIDIEELLRIRQANEES